MTKIIRDNIVWDSEPAADDLITFTKGRKLTTNINIGYNGGNTLILAGTGAVIDVQADALFENLVTIGTSASNGTVDIDNGVGEIKIRLTGINGNVDATSYSASGDSGASGTFTSQDGKTITATNGIITNIV